MNFKSIFVIKTIIKLQNFLYRQYTDPKGSVAVVAAISMIVLIGFSAFVLDLGITYNEASKLQNALDSAVLAGTKELPADNEAAADWLSAESQAIDFAFLNNIIINSNNIEPIYKDNNTSEKIIGIKISKSIEVNYNFAKVFGMTTGTVARTAAAGLSPIGGLSGAIPLSISKSALKNAIDAGAVTGLTIKCSSNANDIGIDCTEVSGWFGALQFDGTGASIYSNLLAYGYSGNLYVGQVLNMENGNMSGPTLDGFTTRYNQCTNGCTAENYEPNCPRLVYIPVVDVISNSQVKIVAFASFFLLECGGNGNNSYIKATYIKDSVLADRTPGTSGQDFGLYVAKLFG